MGIEITGKPSEIQRKITGFHSLDRALLNDRNELGVVINTGYELFGLNHVGKSTFAYSLAGMLAPPKGIVLGDFEQFDPKTFESILNASGFGKEKTGKVRVIQSAEDEETLDTVITELWKDDYAVGIIDSLGAISPLSERDGEIGESNMGQRAFRVGQFGRKALYLFNHSKFPKTIFATNHWYPKIGSRGFDTPAGEAKKYLVSVRILLSRATLKNKKQEYPDGSYILKGLVYKNRWGFKDREFNVFMLAGKGMHRGLSAMYDGIVLGKVSTERGKVKVGDESFGYLKDLVQAAKDGNEELFKPFYDALSSVELVVNETENVEDVEETETE